jgi:plasminogen activator inhibitor 1 RNA-binding protein
MASLNPFAALDSDEEEVPVAPAPKKQSKTNASTKSATKSAPVVRTPAPTPAPAPEKNTIQSRTENSRQDRRPPRNSQVNGEVVERHNGDTRPQQGDGLSRQGRGDGGDRGDRRFGGRGSRKLESERTHDRQSGSGRGREGKKQGGGSHNWGVDTEDHRSAVIPEEQPSQAEEKTPIDNQMDEILAIVSAEAEAEEIDTSMTLDEFQAKLKAEREKASEIFGAVKEKSVDQSEFSGGTLRQKESQLPEDFHSGRPESGEAKKSTKVKKVKQTFVDVGFRAPPKERGGYGQGDRREGGWGRGDRPHRNSYMNSSSHQKIDVNDVSSFPKL